MQELILRTWQNKGILYYLVLIPLSWFFGLLVFLRRALYRIGFLKSFQLPVPVIVVGNINMGGSGKTPVVIWLVEQLKHAGYVAGVVSRGYGGKNVTAREVRVNSLATEVGDEPLMIKKRTGCPVFVSADRVAACHALLQQHANCNVIISDDGLQHYRLQRDIEVAVVDKQTAKHQHLLPAGPLREPFKRLQTIDFIINNGNNEINKTFKMQLHGDQFYNLLATEQKANAHDFSGKNIIAIAGIGQPERFFTHLKNLGLTFQVISFGDHHAFTAADLNGLECDVLLMTEKDAVKCSSFSQKHHWVLPIDAEIDEPLLPLMLQKIKNKTG